MTLINPAGDQHEFRVSVVIPVYNAAAFVTRAVESALEQPETAEVLLVEDGSPDNALEICRNLADKHEKVRLHRHPNGENRGAGASRNMGMKNCLNEFIAFLDADDFFLPGRFTATRKVFEDNKYCDGVYEAAGVVIEDEAGLRNWEQAGRSINHLYTMNGQFIPEELTLALLNSGENGYFHLDGLTLRKNILERSGFMNEALRLHQDTEFIIRVTCVARLMPGNLEKPVAMVRVHHQNRITSPRSQGQKYKNQMAYWKSLYDWSKNNCQKDIQIKILLSIISFTRNHKYFRNFPRQIFPTSLIIASRYFRLLAYPGLILDFLSRPG